VTPLGFVAEAQVVDSSLQQVATGYSFQPLVFTFSASSTSSYHQSVFGHYDGTIGSYTMLAEDIGVDDFGDTPALASPITLGDPPTAGSIQFPGDHDVFTFTISGPQALSFVVGGPLRSSLTVANASGAVLGSAIGPTTLDLQLPAGTYYLTLASANAGELGSYTIQVTP
jgi:hypothetical protein